MDCEFCKVKQMEKELIVAESKNSIAFMCIEPIREGHLLIIPKRHMKEINELTKEELFDLIKLLAKTDKMLQKTYKLTSSFTFVKHGTAKSKEHFHLHLIPDFVPIREALEAYGFSAKARDRKSVEELAKIADKIKSNI